LQQKSLNTILAILSQNITQKQATFSFSMKKYYIYLLACLGGLLSIFTACDGGSANDNYTYGTDTAAAPANPDGLLTMLELYRAPVFRSLEEALQKPREVYRLDLSKQELTTFPSEIFKLNNLQELVLSRNALDSLPATFGELEKLQILDISHNKFKTFPEAIHKLKNLRELNAGNISWASLPAELGQLAPKLQKLNLDQCGFKDVPGVIWQMTQLERLSLRNNALKEIPASLGLLTHLQSLRLSGNELTDLPDALGALTQLYSLELDQNQLKDFPKSLGQLKQLRELSLDNNQISTPDIKSLSLKSLQTLSLSSNQIVSLPDDFFTHFQNLVTLNLSGNQLGSLPESFAKISTSIHLDLSRNPMSWEPTITQLSQASGLQGLSMVSMQDKGQLVRLPEQISHIRALKRLQISQNSLANPVEALRYIANIKGLEELALVGCGLRVVEEFEQLKHLKRLSIDEKLSEAEKNKLQDYLPNTRIKYW
jgi:Leucine-rich repeat (LRR) protein